jgi:hypothetical protein
VVSLFLGTLSILVLCLPFVGYAALGLSGAGLLVGLWGLFRAFLDGSQAGSTFVAGGAGLFRRFGQRQQDFPLAGNAACLLALALALLPFLRSQ